MQALIAMARASGAPCVKLSYDSENGWPGRSMEGGEIVASLDLG